MNKQKWIGVDFDGTLITDLPTSLGPNRLGEPIQPMIARVRRWLSEGRKVKIFTARAWSDGSAERDKWVASAKETIEQFCLYHFGVALEITCEKDAFVEEMWDDRAVGVVRDTGERADGRA